MEPCGCRGDPNAGLTLPLHHSRAGTATRHPGSVRAHRSAAGAAHTLRTYFFVMARTSAEKSFSRSRTHRCVCWTSSRTRGSSMLAASVGRMGGGALIVKRWAGHKNRAIVSCWKKRGMGANFSQYGWHKSATTLDLPFTKVLPKFNNGEPATCKGTAFAAPLRNRTHTFSKRC